MCAVEFLRDRVLDFDSLDSFVERRKGVEP